MNQIYRHIIISVYFIASMIIFWYAHHFLQCSGFMCALGPVLALWTVFIVSSFLIFMAKPLTAGQRWLRFFVSAGVILVLYCAIYDSIYHSSDNENRRFLDYSLPGLLLTVGFTIAWLLPTNLFSRKVNT